MLPEIYNIINMENLCSNCNGIYIYIYNIGVYIQCKLQYIYICIYECEIHTPQPFIYITYFFTKLEMRVLFPPWEGQPQPLLWEEAPKAFGSPQARGACP